MTRSVLRQSLEKVLLVNEFHSQANRPRENFRPWVVSRFPSYRTPVSPLQDALRRRILL